MDALTIELCQQNQEVVNGQLRGSFRRVLCRSQHTHYFLLEFVQLLLLLVFGFLVLWELVLHLLLVLLRRLLAFLLLSLLLYFLVFAFAFPLPFHVSLHPLHLVIFFLLIEAYIAELLNELPFTRLDLLELLLVLQQHLQDSLHFEASLQGFVLANEAYPQQAIPLQVVDVGPWVFGLDADNRTLHFGRRLEVVAAYFDQVVDASQ
jgi:hypothetical protein